jgi:proteasome lid subunit RPN8/RPN11
MPNRKKIKLKKKRLKIKNQKRATKEKKIQEKEDEAKQEKTKKEKFTRKEKKKEVKIKDNGVKIKEKGVIIKENGVKTKENGVKTKENGVKTKENGVIIKENDVKTKENGVIIKENDVKIHYTALNKILRHGFRFSHPKGEKKDWIECMGFLVGDVQDELVEINDAIPMVHGNLVEVEFKDEHYAKADEINQTLTDKNWIVGWYHTHPGHGLFLSPVDKVNHSGYQSLNPSAVALVFDPSKFNERNNFNEYIKFFRLEDANLREKSDFKELDAIEILLPQSEVFTSIYEMSVLGSTDHIMILEYGEKYEETKLQPSPSVYLDAEEVESDLQEMRNLIKHLHREVKVLHGNLQKHMDSAKNTQKEPKNSESNKGDINPFKCEFCGNSSVSSDDAVCERCGKPL